jgi:AraC-like DNA-binding protein
VSYREFQPEPDVRDVLAAAWALDVPESCPRGEPSAVMPDGCVELVVPLDGRVGLGSESRETASAGRAFVVGPLTAPLMLTYDGLVRLCSIRLELIAAARLLGENAPHVLDRAVPLDALAPRLARELAAVADRGPVSDIARRMQRVTAAAVSRSGPVEASLDRALRVLRRLDGRIGVGALAGETGSSTRQLHRVFERGLGLTPKLVGALLRFRRAWELAGRQACPNWAAVAARCGYADQAHLIRAFRRFAGGPPTVAMPTPALGA